MKRTLTYTIREVVPYINWLYYFHAWGMEPRYAAIAHVHDCPSCRAKWIASFTAEEQAKAHEAIRLYDDAMRLLRQWADEPICHAIILIAKAYSEGDDIIIDDATRIPLLRQQQIGKSGYTLCLSDFIAPYTHCRDVGGNISNTIGVFATSISRLTNSAMQTTEAPDTNLELRFQFSTLADRLAEATAEKVHEEVRKKYWGYAKEEQLTMHEIHEERFQGIRPAVGYPSLPDQSTNFLIDKLLHLHDIGINLSENGAMSPHCSVSGFMFAHPNAQYFAIKNISEEQLSDYAHRRGIDINQAKKFLSTIIRHS